MWCQSSAYYCLVSSGSCSLSPDTWGRAGPGFLSLCQGPGGDNIHTRLVTTCNDKVSELYSVYLNLKFNYIKLHLRFCLLLFLLAVNHTITYYVNITCNKAL